MSLLSSLLSQEGAPTPPSELPGELFDQILAEPLAHAWIRAALIVVASFVLAKVADFVISRVARALVRRTKTDLDDSIVDHLHGPVVKTIVLVGLGLAARELGWGQDLQLWIQRGIQTLILVLWLAFALRLSHALLFAVSREADRARTVNPQTFPLFDNLAKVLLLGASAYLLIRIFDWEDTGWLASAGIAGIALGFAAQDTLSNLFAGVLILADAPYRVGDYINLESGERGRVSHIGLRSTRLLTRDDIEVTIPNAIMGNSRIVNESSGPYVKHRIRIAASVAYGSDVDRVRQVLLDASADEPLVCAEPEPRVRFRSFGDSALNFELLCWIPQPEDRGRAVDALNTSIYRRFGAEGIEIPFPKRDLYVKELPAGARADA